MSEAKHTPGPWCISEAENSFEIIQDCWSDDGDHLGEVVVRAPEIDPENGGIRNKADAILIAAAPELLEYLQYAVWAHPELEKNEKLMAVIAKATGGAA